MTHKEIVKALKDLLPDAQYAFSGDNYQDIQWLDERAKPTLEAIQAAIANPLPDVQPTVADKLAAAGLTVDELKEALGL